MQEIKIALKKVLPLVVSEWNQKKLPQMEELFEQSFADLFEGRQTQEKTKTVAPILDSIFARLMKAEIATFEVDEGKGRDYDYNGTPIECKITFGSGNGWTGNGYTKTPIHLLMRFNMSENGIIDQMFAMIADLDQCASKWSEPQSSSNFSTLDFLVEDADKISVVVGDVKINKVKIKPVMESI